MVLGKVNLSYVDALPQLGHAYDVGSTIYSIKESHFSVSSSPQGKLLQDNREQGRTKVCIIEGASGRDQDYWGGQNTNFDCHQQNFNFTVPGFQNYWGGHGPPLAPPVDTALWPC